MSSKPRPPLSRRVVTGIDAEGRSVIVSDRETPTWVRRPTGSVIMDIWRVDSLPASVDAEPDDEPTEGGEPVLAPPVSGVCVRIAVFPPDKDVDDESVAAYETAMEKIYGAQSRAADSSTVPGMHRTDTVDIVTVIEGEIWAVLEDGETLLRAGDSLVQRGTKHAWRNRSDRPCTLTTTMLAGVRE
jgi:hypothetical protein